MNVTLNIPPETGAERTGASQRRAGDAEASTFGAVLDEVAPAAERGRQSQPASAGTPDESETDVGPGRAYQRHDGLWGARDAAAEEEKGADAPVASEAADDTATPADPLTACVQSTDQDVPPPATWQDDAQAMHRDGKRGDPPDTQMRDADAASPDAVAAPPSETGNTGTTRRDADKGRSIGRDCDPSDRKDDGKGKQADAQVDVPPVAAVALPAAAEGAKQALGKSGKPATGDDRSAAKPVGRDVPSAKAEQDQAATSSAGSPPAESRQARSGAAGKVAAAHSGAAEVRVWANGDTAAALAASRDGGRRQQVGSTAKAPEGDRQAAPSRGGDAPINVRVTAFERHIAPATVAASAAKAIEGDAGTAKTIAPASPSKPQEQGAAKAEAAAAGMPRLTEKDRGGRVAAADRNGRTTAGTAPATGQARVQQDQLAVRQDQVATRQDHNAMADTAQSSAPDTTDGREGKAMPSASQDSPHHGEQTRPVVSAPSPAAGPAAAASAPAAAPLTAGVARGIAGAIDATRAAAPQSPPQGVNAGMAGAQAEPVRTIVLNLDMREYGALDLRISLRGSSVSVQLKAERAETAQALARDDASLRDLLHRAGYDVQQLQVDRRDAAQPRSGDAATFGQQQQAGGAGSGAPFGQAGGDQRAATSGGRQPPQGNAGTFDLHDQDTPDAPRQDRYRGADRLYV